ncbi:zinc finger-like domain protein [Rickettsiales bacterium Ac37b]|nr:zinc finger-like domain protein [Rickettsiales bacterium Ac37b]
MIITCNKCNTSYLVEVESIGINGRKVKCLKCSHIWMAILNEEQLKELSSKETEIIQSDPSEDVEKPIEGITSVPALMQPKVSPVLKIVPVMLLILLLLMSGLFYNHKIIEYVPSASSMYIAAGLYPSNGLIIDNVVVKEEQEQYSISYVIKNTNDIEIYMPLVRVTVFDDKKNNVAYQKVKIKHKLLEPGESYVNNTNILIPDNATYIVVDLGNKWELFLRQVSDLIYKIALNAT